MLTSNVDRDGGSATSCSGIILIVLFVTLTAGNIVWLVYTYIEFTGEDCGGNLTIIIVTTVIGVINYGAVLIRTRDDASVFTSAVVFTYQIYLQWSALSSKPETACNPYTESAGNTTMEIIVGLFFTFLSLLVIGGSTTKSDDETVTNTMGAHVMEKEDAN